MVLAELRVVDSVDFVCLVASLASIDSLGWNSYRFHFVLFNSLLLSQISSALH